jgi:molybdopterin converting factor small subunit
MPDASLKRRYGIGADGALQYQDTGSVAMTITIHIPGVLRACCAGATALTMSASSVRVALELIERSHPALYRSICDETGAVRRHVNLFVNTAHMRDRQGLDTPLAPGDVLTILPAVSGG